MSTDETSWSTSAEAERIKSRKQSLERKRDERADENPVAFGWEATDDETYRCLECDREFQTLPGCLRHLSNKRESGQTGLDEWA